MRKANLLLLVLFTFTTVIAGCGDDKKRSGGGGDSDSLDAVAEDYFALLPKVSEIVESINDEASAEEANDKLKDLASEIEDIVQRLDDLGGMTKKQSDEYKEQHKDDVDAAGKKQAKEFARIQKDHRELIAKIQPGLDALNKQIAAMKKLASRPEDAGGDAGGGRGDDGGEFTQDTAAKEAYDILAKWHAILQTVRDQSSAENANTQLSELADRATKLVEKAALLEDASPEDSKRLEQEYMPKMTRLQRQMQEELGRIGRIDRQLVVTIMPGINKLGKALADLK